MLDVVGRIFLNVSSVCQHDRQPGDLNAEAYRKRHGSISFTLTLKRLEWTIMMTTA
jgi:hypothetical protein